MDTEFPLMHTHPQCVVINHTSYFIILLQSLFIIHIPFVFNEITIHLSE